ncbi:flagellar hook-associated protein FlgK [Aureibacillus halotolerans]|uniref:Flagellar hook-associated protein 1 n=1 Tax=Aureibacillus halotolerans TaxID=1508390 RepID=A0A4R6TY27_9BACI|nr:flagellar hook-associated protein FlgK [Aureibacillus halotolerans]TDQ36929.1 flagellar hook-associated protein 1 FlgK [Aureibacillus halotolerans]
MTSTFHGLETALRAIHSQQRALQTLSHNVANANTPGYTRQRVNFEASNGFPAVGRNQPQIPGHLGSGVEVGDIQRIRNEFFDYRFRTEQTKASYWGNRFDSISRLEGLMNVQSDNGLPTAFNEFFNSLQTLAKDASDLGARSVVRQNGMALANTFNYLHENITEFQRQAKNEISQSADEINSMLERINGINKQIGEVEPHGYVPNDLYDKRDMLVDALSSLVNIKTTEIRPGGNASSVAEGKISIEIVKESGASYDPPIQLLNGKSNEFNEFSVTFDGENGPVNGFAIGDTTFSFNDAAVDLPAGTLKAKVEAYGYTKQGQEAGIYPDMMKELDKLAYTFAKAFNTQHSEGISLVEMDSDEEDIINFFVGEGFTFAEDESFEGFAGKMRVSQEIMDNADLIAAASNEFSGDGGNAQALADLMKSELDFGDGSEFTFTDYYEKIIGTMGVTAAEAETLRDNSQLALLQVDLNRQAVSGVSLDEEMTNMVKFQHAYNAAARTMTAVDEMLDRIINGMGRVGR